MTRAKHWLKQTGAPSCVVLEPSVLIPLQGKTETGRGHPTALVPLVSLKSFLSHSQPKKNALWNYPPDADGIARRGCHAHRVDGGLAHASREGMQELREAG